MASPPAGNSGLRRSARAPPPPGLTTGGPGADFPPSRLPFVRLQKSPPRGALGLHPTRIPPELAGARIASLRPPRGFPGLHLHAPWGMKSRSRGGPQSPRKARPAGTRTSLPAGEEGSGQRGHSALLLGLEEAFWWGKPLTGCPPEIAPGCHFGHLWEMFFPVWNNFLWRPRPRKGFFHPFFHFLDPENFCPHFGPRCRWDFLGHFLTHLFFGMVSTGQHSMHDTGTWGDMVGMLGFHPGFGVPPCN